MPKMIYDFFDEEDPFTASNLKQRFDAAQDAINDLEVASALAKGCLNDSHLPSFLSFSATTEFELANKLSSLPEVCGYGVTSDEGTAPGDFINGDSYYYNQLNTAIGFNPIGQQEAMPDDGVWEPVVESGVAPFTPLEVRFPPTDLNDFVNPVLVVLMNVHVERVAFNWVGTTWPQNTAMTESQWFMANGVAFAIQMRDADNLTWHHVYDRNGNTPAPARRLRRTERRIGVQTLDKNNPPTSQASTSIVPSYRDVAIRCAITANDLQEAYDGNGQEYNIDRIDRVRGVLSLIACTGSDGGATPVETTVYCAISNANLSVLMPRCKMRSG